MVIERGTQGIQTPVNWLRVAHRSDTTDSIGAILSEAPRIRGDCSIFRSLYVHRKSVTRRFPWDFLAIISLQRRFHAQALAR